MKGHLFVANVFDEDGALDSLQGKIDLHTSAASYISSAGKTN